MSEFKNFDDESSELPVPDDWFDRHALKIAAVGVLAYVALGISASFTQDPAAVERREKREQQFEACLNASLSPEDVDLVQAPHFALPALPLPQDVEDVVIVCQGERDQLYPPLP